MGVHGDLPFIHRFEQRGLRLGRGAIDFIREQHVGEDRASLKFEFLLDGGIDRDAEYVRWQHVAGELNALKTAVDRPRKRLAERGLADSGSSFNQQVTFGEDGNQRQAEHVVLSADDSAKRSFEVRCAAGSRYHGLGSH